MARSSSTTAPATSRASTTNVRMRSDSA
jgi:hypothetical protein